MIDKEEYRKKIVLTAGRIFSNNGFRKTTMEEISKALKKGKSSIYYYFGSKEEIFEAVVLYEAKHPGELEIPFSSDVSIWLWEFVPLQQLEKSIWSFHRESSYGTVTTIHIL